MKFLGGNIKFKYDNLVLGGSLDALYFAFKEGYPIIYKDLEKPFELDEASGKNKKELTEQILFLLAISNLHPFANKVEEMRVEGNKVFVSGKRPWIAEIDVGIIHDFRDIQAAKYKVVDWVNVRSCGPHDFHIITGRSNFAKEVHFYPSQRSNETKNFYINKNPKLEWKDLTKDIQIVSYLNKKQLDDEEYGPIYSRIKAKQMMKDAGIVGRKRWLAYPKQRLGIRLEFAKREVFKLDPVADKDYKLESKNKYIQLIMRYFNDSRSTSKKKQLPPSWDNPGGMPTT